MNYSALIQNRKSVREFTEKYVSMEDVDKIKRYHSYSVRRLFPEVKTELSLFGLDARAALEGAAGYKQFLVGSPQYMVLLSEKHPHALENAGFIISNEYKMTDAELALNIWKQGMAASYAIGVDYEQHFYRPANINNANDQRTHFFAGKLGYHGIATYTHSYAGHSIDTLADTLKSGNIYRFDMSEASLELFKLFVRAASEKGYQLVTLNELFGYEENQLSSELTIDRQTLPTMDDYVPSLYDLELGDRARAVIDLQKRLMELDYLDVNEIPDGVYGSKTSVAVSRFQASVSLPATGDANVATLEKLYGELPPASAADPE